MAWDEDPRGLDQDRTAEGSTLAEPPRQAGHVPGKREVDLYVRTYTTLLQSSGAIGISSLEQAHLTAASALHAGAAESVPDMNAFMYAVQRLPACIVDVRHLLFGQTAQAFVRAGYQGMERWSVVAAPARRRKWLFDGEETLAAYIASASDLDDVIPTAVAFQIEWNKLHRLFQADPELLESVRVVSTHGGPPTGELVEEVRRHLLLEPADWERVEHVWGVGLWPTLLRIATERLRLTLRMLSGSYVGYARSTRQWWTPVAGLLAQFDLLDRPVYFVSSNTHSIVNVLSGTARRREAALTESIRRARHPELLPVLERLEAGDDRASKDNLLYFAARHHFAAPGMDEERQRRNQEERELGISSVEPRAAIDVGVQVIELAKLDPSHFDPRLRGEDGERPDPRRSDAVIINVNYPLGLAAYHIMAQVGMSIDRLRGIYILGKAATLNGRIGDVMIANVVFDEHSGNTYWLENCFTLDDLARYTVYGSILDNQKALTVKGTFLQNQGYLDFYYRENYTVIEMEAGPYLNAIYEDLFLRRYPTDEAVNLAQVSGHLDLGILHYASDTPYTRAQTLGARGLSYHGMDSTYASTIAILRRIFQQAGVFDGATMPRADGQAAHQTSHTPA